MNTTSLTVPEPNVARSRALYVLAVAVFPILVAGLLSALVFLTGAVQPSDGIGHKTRFAQFEYPAPGDLVGDTFTVSGLLNTVPEDEVVYLVERTDAGFWPKQRLGSSSIAFSREQYAGAGKGYKYTIELLSLNGSAQQRVDEWFEAAEKTGKRPGITNMDGATVLAKVRVIHR